MSGAEITSSRDTLYGGQKVKITGRVLQEGGPRR